MRKKIVLSVFIIFALSAAASANALAGNKTEDAGPYSFNTKDVAPDVVGAGGHIEMLVTLDVDGEIKDIKILKQNETPGYGSMIMRQEFLEQFKGKGADDAFIIGKDIDAVTGATVSSEAVADILKICLERLGKKPSVPLVTELKKSGIEPREAKYYKVIE